MRRSVGGSSRVVLLSLALAAAGSGSALAQDASAVPVDQATFDATAQVVNAALDPTSDTSLPVFWAETFPTFSEQPYHDPQGGIYPYVTGEPSDGACGEDAEGAAQNASYCGADESITYDLEWFAEQAARYGIAAPLTVIAHEWGHHIQAVAGSPEISKQAELQADCYAGMYLGFLEDEGIVTADDVTAMLEVVYAIGDDPSDPSAWTDPDVHGRPEERRQAAGIGFSTGDGSYCVAYGDWQDEPVAELFGGNAIRLEPFADPVPLEDGSYGIELPGAQVQVFEVQLAPEAVAADELAAQVLDTYPDAAGWELSEPDPTWIEAYGWATGTGAQMTFTGTFADGTAAGGAAALLLDPDGSGQLFVAIGADEADAEVGVAQAQGALAALTWGYCDPEAEVTDNCPTA